MCAKRHIPAKDSSRFLALSPTVCLCVYLSQLLSVSLFLFCLSASLSVCLSVCVCLCVCMPLCVCVPLSAFLSVCLATFLCLSASASVCASDCLPLCVCLLTGRKTPTYVLCLPCRVCLSLTLSLYLPTVLNQAGCDGPMFTYCLFLQPGRSQQLVRLCPMTCCLVDGVWRWTCLVVCSVTTWEPNRAPSSVSWVGSPSRRAASAERWRNCATTSSSGT